MRLKEEIDIKVIYCDDTPSEYIDDVTMNDIYDILDSSPEICKILDVSGSKKKVVWTDEYGFERAYESKKSVKKSMKESKDTDFFNAMVKKFNFTKDEIKKYKDKTYISVIGILFDRIRSVPTHSDEWYNAMNDCWEGIQVAEDNGFNVDYEKKTYDKIMMTPNYNRESKKSDKKSMKEAISKSTWGDWIVDKVERVEGFYNGSPNVRPQLINNLIESIGLNANGHILTFDDIAEEITKGIRAYKLKDLDSWHVHLGHNNDGLRVDLNAKVEHFSEVINHNGKYTVVSVYFYVDEQGTNKEYDFGFVADVLVEINPYIDFVLEESKKSDKKSVKESVKPEIQLMVNDIIDELIGKYSSKEWDSLSANEKFDIVRTEYFSFGYKSKYLSEVRDLVIENMNHPFNVVFESKKSAKKSLNEKVSSKYKYTFKHEGDYEIMQFDDYNYEILAIPSDKSLFSNDLPKLKIEKTYIYDQYNDDIWLFVGEVEELGWCFIAFDKLANNDNIYAYQYGKRESDAYMPYQSYKLYLENKKVYQTHNLESKKFTKKSIKESFDDGDQLVIDVVDMLIFDFKYDKKTVEKYFYKIHKLNDFDAISIDEYIKIKEEIEKALGLDDIF